MQQIKRQYNEITAYIKEIKDEKLKIHKIFVIDFINFPQIAKKIWKQFKFLSIED